MEGWKQDRPGVGRPLPPPPHSERTPSSGKSYVFIRRRRERRKGKCGRKGRKEEDHATFLHALPAPPLAGELPALPLPLLPDFLLCAFYLPMAANHMQKKKNFVVVGGGGSPQGEWEECLSQNLGATNTFSSACAFLHMHMPPNGFLPNSKQAGRQAWRGAWENPCPTLT